MSARDVIYYIRCGACDVASDLVGSVVAVTNENIPHLYMVLADYISVGFIPIKLRAE